MEIKFKEEMIESLVKDHCRFTDLEDLLCEFNLYGITDKKEIEKYILKNKEISTYIAKSELRILNNRYNFYRPKQP